MRQCNIEIETLALSVEPDMIINIDQLVIGIVRIVMKENQMAVLGLMRKMGTLDGGTVSPIFFLDALMNREVGVENEQIGPGEELSDLAHFVFRDIFVFRISGIYNALSFVLHSVSE